ncbi:MAG: hypothetical protein ACRD2C_26485 [Acidimicrobiales bacterium]
MNVTDPVPEIFLTGAARQTFPVIVGVTAMWTMTGMNVSVHHLPTPRARAGRRAVHYAGPFQGLVEVQRHVPLDVGGHGLVAGGVPYDVYVKGTTMPASGDQHWELAGRRRRPRCGGGAAAPGGETSTPLNWVEGGGA